MLANNEYAPYLGMLGGFQSSSKNPFVNMFNNMARMQLMQSLYTPQPQQDQLTPMQPTMPFAPLPTNYSNNGIKDVVSSGLNDLTQGVNSGVNGMVGRIANAIGHVESSNNYKALGQQTRTGDRAYGKYQVMGNNVPIWTKEVLGQSMTPQQFLANQEAQDRVAMAKMGQYYNKYKTPHDVASMWFSGRPSKGNYNKDVTGTNVPEYMKRVMKYMG